MNDYLAQGWELGQYQISNTGKASTEEAERERRNKISRTMKLNKKSGGYRNGSGNGHKGWYKGIFCDSSWELAYVIYNIEHNISFEKNHRSFFYTYKNETFKYIPDFIENGVYVEIKGYVTDKWIAKLSQFKYDIIVLYKKDMTKYINYVVKKYGKDFIKLYE